MGRTKGSRVVNDVVKKTVATLLSKNPDFTAKELKRESEKLLKDKGFNYKFTDRTYLKIKTALLKNKNEIDAYLDVPWSIGSMRHNLPADMILVLIQTQQFMEWLGLKMTVRQAIWFSRLYPIVHKMSKKHYKYTNVADVLLLVMVPSRDREQLSLFLNRYKELHDFLEIEGEETKQNIAAVFWLAMIGVQYAKQEQIAELVGDKTSDTTELDNLYFIRDDFSASALLDGFWYTFATSEQKKQRAHKLANFKGWSAEELEPIFGKLTSGQVESWNELQRVSLSKSVSGEEWKKKHPEEWAELTKAMEAKANERQHNQEK